MTKKIHMSSYYKLGINTHKIYIDNVAITYFLLMN